MLRVKCNVRHHQTNVIQLYLAGSQKIWTAGEKLATYIIQEHFTKTRIVASIAIETVDIDLLVLQLFEGKMPIPVCNESDELLWLSEECFI